eukprot:g421.t1
MSAVDLHTGELRWQIRTGKMLSSPQLVKSLGLVVLGTHNRSIEAYDAATGALAWTTNVNGSVWALSGALVDEDGADGEPVGYFGCDDGRMYALALQDGRILWTFSTAGPIQSAPAGDRDAIYFGSFDAGIYAVDKKSGEGKWRFQTKAPFVSSSPAVADGVVYVGGYDGTMYALSSAGTAGAKGLGSLGLLPPAA